MAALLHWQTWVHSPLGGVHFIAALVALIAGPMIFASHKGTGFHRVMGYVFVVCMAVVNGSALMTYTFSGGPNIFHFFALLSLSALIPGFWAIWRVVRGGRQDLLETHIRCMMWAYYGLAAAGLAQVMTRILPPLLNDFGWTFAVMGTTFGLSGAAMAWFVRRSLPGLTQRYRPGATG